MAASLLVLTSPLNQMETRFVSFMQQIIEIKNLTRQTSKSNSIKLYVQLLPGLKKWPLLPNYFSINGINCDSFLKTLSIYSKVIRGLYVVTSDSFPQVDLHVLLHGIKNPEHINSDSLTQLLVKPRQFLIQSVFFEPEVQADSFIDFISSCFPVSIPFPSFLLLKEPTNSSITEYKTDGNDEISKIYNSICLGGTFDGGLHNGHKLLLSEALLRIRFGGKITVGVTEGPGMLRSKKLSQLILPVMERIDCVEKFLHNSCHEICTKVVAITDSYGPSIEDENIEAIIGSVETKPGCAKVNEKRCNKGMSALDIILVPVISTSANSSVKISSSQFRISRLGTRLKPQIKAWNVNTPYVIGITGMSGSGKSSISAYLAQAKGVKVIDCDKMAHRCYLPGSMCYSQIIEAFGAEIVNPEDNNINRALLASRVFSHESERHRLEAIVWPELLKFVYQEMVEKSGILVLDAAVLLKAPGFTELCHDIWLVLTSTEEEGIQRIMQRDNISEIQARNRLEAQNEMFFDAITQSTFLFCTSWSRENTRSQVDRAWDIICLERHV